MSVIKLNKVLNEQIDTHATTNLSGVGEGLTTTIGKVYTDLIVEDILIRHEFHVVENNFPIPVDGIIGIDFIRNYNCMLDYQRNQDFIILRPDHFDTNIAIPLKNAPEENSITLPARSEVIRLINVKSSEDVFLVPQQIIQDGVYIANTITSKFQPLVRFLNTTDKNLFIKNLQINTESLNDYNIVQMGTNVNNKKEKLRKLAKNFPPFVSNELNTLCSEFIDIFGLETEKVSVNNFYKQKLKLNDDEPTYIKNYRIPHSHKEEVKKQVHKLLEDDIIEPSVSNYNSPILLVPKKPLPGTNEKRWRLVVDYRAINKKLVADKFPLPRIDDILDQLGRAKFFSSLDLISGFHQVELEENSRDITSFSAEQGAFRFKRLPYGIKVAPNSFQRMMSLAFSGLKPAQAFLYMDDLIIIGCSTKHMLQNLKDVFSICRKYNLKLNPDKCTFFRNEIIFLGHKCTDRGILPDDSKYSVIKNYPTPKNGDEAKRFVAFCNYYRRFIPNFAESSRHLSRLSRKNVPFEWSRDCEEAFQYLKNQLLSPKILQYPDFSKKFCITTDASKHTCGAVLSQEYQGVQLPIAYASRAFTRGESNKSTIEQELAAIHWAIQYFRPYVYGKKFIVRTDHRPLTYLFSMKNPSSKLTRIRLDLEEYDFEVDYIRGKENYAADALSRIEFSEIQKANINKIFKVTTRLQTRNNEIRSDGNAKGSNVILSEMLHVFESINTLEYSKVPRLYFSNNKFIIQHGKNKLYESRNPLINGKIDLDQLFPQLEKVASKMDISRLQLSIADNLFHTKDINEFKDTGNRILKKLNIVLVPPLTKITSQSDKEKIIQKYHDDPVWGGHPGITRLLKKIRRKYHWRNMTRDISRYVKRCDKCQKSKVTIKTKEPFIITPTPTKAFDIVVIDTVGPLPKSDSGHEYAVTIMCDLTKYLIAVPVENKSAKSIAKAIFEEFVLIYGPMKKILTDMGTEYMNQLLHELCTIMKVEKLHSTPYHHETLGTIERSHRTLNEYLRTYISTDKSDWNTWLKFFVYCYNTTPSVVHEYCPFELVFGKTPPVLDFVNKDRVEPLYNIDSYNKEVKFRLEVAHRRAADFLEKAKLLRKKHSEVKSFPININENDLVLVSNEAGHKLDQIYNGPFTVVRMDDRNNVLVSDDNGTTSWVHKNRLKAYKR